MYTFYDDGFFGYGKNGDFTYFSLAHILPILLTVLAVFVTYKYRDRIRGSKYEKTFRYTLSFILMLAQMSYYWRLLYVGDETGRYSMLVKLPLELCEWNAMCCIYMLITKNKFLFNYNYFGSLSFGVGAMLMPTVLVNTGPGYYRYYQFWMVHLIPLFSVFYMMFVHHLKPDMKIMYAVLGVMCTHALIAIQLNNMIPGANFLFMAGYPKGVEMGDNVLNYLPSNQYVRLLCIAVIAVVLFNGLYFLYRKCAGKNIPETN